jgi:tetratricopeptide (TPR) repeat protein
LSSNNDRIHISENQGDVIGVGIDGNGNIIGKNVSIVINEFSQDCGLTLLSQNHFKENNDITESVEKWKKGFPFSLESIYQKQEFRRERVVTEIITKLDEKKRLLILGESGTSKTTLLMEILCDCFDNGYMILYNFGRDSLRNTDSITTKIKGLANANNKVLIVIDDVQNAKLSLIFNIIDALQPLNKSVKDKIHFLLAARQPEFDWILEKNLWGDTNTVQIIEQLFDENYKYSIPYFALDEIKEFILKYKDFLYSTKRNKTVDDNANDILKDTNGYPIMVRFSVLHDGLKIHVKEMYREYLLDKNNNPNIDKIKTIILNSLFDISTISLKNELLEEFGLITIAKKELMNTIIKKTGDVWKTIHPKWDMELLRYMFSLEYSLDDIVNSFKDILHNIVSTENIIGFDKVHILFTIYYVFIKERVTTSYINKKIINLNEIESKLDNKSKALFYANVIGFSRFDLGLYDEAIVELDKALNLNPNYDAAYFTKGISLSRLGKDEEAIVEYDKGLKINPNGNALLLKGLSLSRLGKDEEAIVEYDKGLKINPNDAYAYNNKGLSLHNLGRYVEAIVEYDKSLQINPNDADTFYLKGNSLALLYRYVESIVEYDKAIELNPKYDSAFNNKGLSLYNLGRYVEAIVEYDKGLKINPNDAYAYNNKGLSLYNLGRYAEAIVEYDNALKLNPNYVNAYYGKGNSLSKLGKDEEAIVEYDNALKLNPHNAEAYFTKGASLCNLGRYAEAIVEFNKTIEINPNDAIAFYNKGLSLYNLGRYTEAILEYDKTIEINPKYDSAYNNKGFSLSKLGKDDEAIAEFDKALEINPNNTDALNNKGNSLYNLGRYTEAIAEFDKGIELNPKYDSYFYNKGNSLYNLGRYTEAILEYDNALKLNPKYDSAYNNKGFSLSKLGKYEQAIVEFNKAIEINPNNLLALNNKQLAQEKLEKEDI